MPTETTIFCPKAIRELWPRPVADHWLKQYPHIFDAEDRRLAKTQPSNHFCEWFAAIHLFQRDGMYSLLEKYIYKSHSKKVATVQSILKGEQWEMLNVICDENHVQPPDLFLYHPGTRMFSFAEVKGPGDRLSEKQLRSHKEIYKFMGVTVEIIRVRIAQ